MRDDDVRDPTFEPTEDDLLPHNSYYLATGSHTCEQNQYRWRAYFHQGAEY